MKEVSLTTEIDRLAQITVEDTYSKSNIRRNIREYFTQYVDLALPKLATALIEKHLQGEYYASKNARLDQIRHISAEELMLDVMSVICPIETPIIIQGPAANIGQKFEYSDVFDGVKTAAELITLCAQAGLVELHLAGTQEESIAVCSNVPPNQELNDWLKHIRYPNPMLCVPEKWQNNINGGYITFCNSVLLGKQTHHENTQSIDALNILQDIAWELDPDVLKEDELPKKIDTKEEALAFIQMARISNEVYEELGDKPFWFVWRFDFRGRAYSHGYYVNLQSSEYKKALLNLAKKEKVR